MPAPRAPAGRMRARLAASRAKPAPIAAGQERPRSVRTPQMQRAAGLRRPGDLWRFRKANARVTYTPARRRAAPDPAARSGSGCPVAGWSKIPFCEGWKMEKAPPVVRNSVLRRVENGKGRFFQPFRPRGREPRTGILPAAASGRPPTSVSQPSQNGIFDQLGVPLRFSPFAKRLF